MMMLMKLMMEKKMEMSMKMIEKEYSNWKNSLWLWVRLRWLGIPIGKSHLTERLHLCKKLWKSRGNLSERLTTPVTHEIVK
jgi:hypothetical protein